jgi:hypothetical protein
MKFLIWPVIFWLLHVYNQYTMLQYSPAGDMGFRSVGYLIVDVWIIVAIIFYILLSVVYIFYLKRQHKTPTNLMIVLLGFCAFILAFIEYGFMIITDGREPFYLLASKILETNYWKFPFSLLH